MGNLQVLQASSKCYAIEPDDLAIIPDSGKPLTATGGRGVRSLDN